MTVVSLPADLRDLCLDQSLQSVPTPEAPRLRLQWVIDATTGRPVCHWSVAEETKDAP